ncbi:MAG: hypothetical protein H7315_17105 [Herminiimonas sp.]|nr:hypothetical protein [Herminiimonas sp.]
MFFKKKLTWRRPLFYVLLPIFFVMAFLGFPIPVAPPYETKARQEESAPIKKKKRFDTVREKDKVDGPVSSDIK